MPKILAHRLRQQDGKSRVRQGCIFSYKPVGAMYPVLSHNTLTHTHTAAREGESYLKRTSKYHIVNIYISISKE